MFCSFAHGEAPAFDFAAGTILRELCFEGLVIFEPVVAVFDVVHEIGANGQAEKIRRCEIHTDGLREIQYIQLSTALRNLLQYW